MGDDLCICSLDTVVLVGEAVSLAQVRRAIEQLGASSSFVQLSSYEQTDYLHESTRVSWGFRGGNPRRVRIEFSPSRVDEAALASLLALLRRVYVQRCDVALDYFKDIQEYEFHCSHLSLSRHMLSRQPHPHSYAFGQGDSHRRLAVYDKLRKCRADRIWEARIVDVHGEIHLIPIRQLIESDTSWLRVEARLKGHWILDGATPRPGVFDDLIAKQRRGVSLGLDLRTEATLELLSREPEAIRRLGRDSRPKYRRYLRRLEEQHGLIPSPADVYRDNYIPICDVLKRLCESGCDE